MPNKLFASMGLSICGMVFLILVFIMYMSKKKFKNFENNIFLFMFVIAFIALINEYIYIFAMYAELDAKIKFFSVKPLCYSYILLCAVWLSSLITYIWYKLYSDSSEEVKKKKRIVMVIFMILFVVFMFSVSCVLGVEYPTSNSHLYVFSGSAVYVLYLIGIVALILVGITIFLKGKNIPIYQKMPIFFCITILVVINAIQLILDYDFNSLAYLFVFVITTLYFTVESQDHKLIDELKRKKDEAEIADNAQTEFLANMSHEIRTPLNTILGFSDSLLSEENLTKEVVDRDVSMINEASNNLLDLIKKILAISKIESGKESIIEEKYNLNDLIQQLDKDMIKRTDKRDIKFRAELAPDIPLEFIGDYNKIYNMLLYIFENSLKYTAFGNISLRIFGVKLDENNFNLVFKITNTGTEMSSDKFNISFNDFVKLGDKNQNTIDGATLGLIIAKIYVELLGGTIEFISNDVSKVQYIIKINQKIEAQDISNKHLKRILIIDNEPLELKEKLDKYNFVIDEIDNINNGLEIIKNNNYDVIFIDKKMLNFDINDIKDKIILLVNQEDSNYNFDNILIKPIKEKDLDNCLNKILK